MFVPHVIRDLSPYSEGALPPGEAARVAQHLLSCERCRRALDPVRAGARLARTLAPVTAPASLWSELEVRIETPRPWRVGWWRLTLAVAAAVAIAIGLPWWLRDRVELSVATGAPSPLETAALEAHAAAAPLDYETGDPERLHGWIADETGLQVYLAALEQKLEGARIVRAGGVRAVAIAYRTSGCPTTLVVSPRRPLGAGAPAPGLLRKHIAYRRDAARSLNVLSWTRGEQSYALVSALPGVGQEACFVCHTDPDRRALIARLALEDHR